MNDETRDAGRRAGRRGRLAAAGVLMTAAVLMSAAAVTLLAGCSAAATDGLVRTGVKATEADRAIVEDLLASPEVQRATQVLTRSVVDAAMADLAAPQRQEQLHQLAAGFAESVVPVVAAAIDQQVLPQVRSEVAAGLRGTVETAVQAAIDQGLRPENRGRARELSRELAATAVGAASPALASAIDGGVRAGITHAVAQMLGGAGLPSGATGAGNAGNAGNRGAEFDRRLAEALRAGSQGAFLGLADALHGSLGTELRRQQHDFLDEVHRDAAAERQAWISEIHAERDTWLRNFVMLAVIAGALFLALLAAVLWLNHLLRENRQLRGTGGTA